MDNSAMSAMWKVTLGPGWGWSVHRLGAATVHLRGCIFDGARTLTGMQAAEHAVPRIIQADTDAALKQAFSRLAGHFALVIETPERLLATVDRTRSIPLMFGALDDVVMIDDRGPRLRDALGRGVADIDVDQALACAMSGYCVGAGTLYRGLQQLRAGEALCVDQGGQRRMRWFIYEAWRTQAIADPERRLSELHRHIMERLAASADGRTVAVPLSAGLDSRFIASGLKAVGYKNVQLFSYGRAGNHEAETAKAIADRLGYPWTFVPFTTAGQTAMFADPAHEAALWQHADTCGGAPFEQDWTAISALRAEGLIPADALVVNGQTGDFITGNHISPALAIPVAESAEARRSRVTSAIVAKHHRLWQHLATPENDARIKALLDAEIDDAGADLENGDAHGIYEMLEYQDRQAKYVISGQRTYDALGLDWRLPLWDDEYIEFWQHMPLEHKLRQSLYKKVLESDNWGGVWTNIPVNAKTITPSWIRPLRLAAKAVTAPLGRDAWHRLERRAFTWWMDPLRASTVVPYSQALRERRGARHAVSFIAERYLLKHGVTFEAMGTP
jgi:asparagine synthase (glutamine-hydrolysing)